MSEIEQMMQNANVKKHWNSTPYGGVEEYYPPFTAEKQIELIKNISPAYPLNYHIKCFQGYSFEEGLAKCINNLWEYLPEEQKQQVKGILE